MPPNRKSERTMAARLATSLCLNAIIALTEITGGLLSGSVALIADATHNLGDVFALALAFLARSLSSRPPSFRHSYGLKRFEVLAASLNAAALVAVAVLVIKSAFIRFLHPEPVQAGIIILVATVALVANGASVLLLRHHHPHDLNIRSAFFHLLLDVFSSLLVLVSAVLARTRFGTHLDSIAAIIIGVSVLFGAVSILREAFGTLLEGVPDGIHMPAVVTSVEGRFSGVAMHHVHVWQIGPGQCALTAHILVPNMHVAQAENLCSNIRSYLQEEWRIQHVTLEPEVKGCGLNTVLGVWEDALENDFTESRKLQ